MQEEHEAVEPTDGIAEGEADEGAPEGLEQTDEAPFSELESEDLPEGKGLSDEELINVIQVLLLVSDKPLSAAKIKDVVDDINPGKVKDIVSMIQEKLQKHGLPFQVREVAGGYVLSSLPEYAPWIRKMYSPKAKVAKLSQAALETLAVVAYKQPVTRGEIEAIRGVSVDSTLKTLLERRLVEIAGYKDVIGKPATYCTTSEFLLQFGLKALSDLPSIEELRRSEPES